MLNYKVGRLLWETSVLEGVYMKFIVTTECK